MKIYHKKNFAAGLGLILLGGISLAVMCWTGLQVKSLLLSALCLFFGIGCVLRSISKEDSIEDRLNEQDERNRLVALKYRATSFRATQLVSFVLACGFFLLGKITDSQMFVYVGIGMVFTVFVGMLAELCAMVYHEAKN